jgi:hypothetical protein
MSFDATFCIALSHEAIQIVSLLFDPARLSK